MKPITDDIMQTALLKLLETRKGPEMRIKRVDLRIALSSALNSRVSDRSMRKNLETLRVAHTRGAWICADTEGGGGYFMARDLRELESYLNSDEARIIHLAKRIRAQRKSAGLAESGQLRLL